MKKIVTLLGLLSSIFVSFTSFANSRTSVEICNDCNVKQIKYAAERGGRKNGGNGVIVVDLKNKIANKYSIYNYEGRFGEPKTDVYEVGMSVAESNDVVSLYAYSDATVEMIKEAEGFEGFQLQKSNNQKNSNTLNNDKSYLYSGEIDVRGNPFDFLTTSSFRNNVYDYYFTGDKSITTRIIASSIKAIKIPNMSKMGISIRINFYSDVSGKNPVGFILVEIDTDRLLLNPISARDQKNNSIPLQKPQAYGVFKFKDQEHRENFEKYIKRMSWFGNANIGGSGGGCSWGSVSYVDNGDSISVTYHCS